MKKTIITACVALAAICCKAQQMDSAAMMKAWQNYMTPGEMHKMLAKSSGLWNGEVTIWMMPGAPPQKSKSTAENKMIMNGLYQHSMHKGMMDGMPFEGMSTVGFDNAKKVFVTSWVDNMGSGIMHMEGPWDPATKSMTLTGQCTDPMTGKVQAVREVFKIIDDNTQMMEMYMPGPDGKEFKMMEIRYTRAK